LLVIEEEDEEKHDEGKETQTDEDFCVNWTATCTYCTCKKWFIQILFALCFFL